MMKLIDLRRLGQAGIPVLTRDLDSRKKKLLVARRTEQIGQEQN
ncbi:hypothetical protein [Paenibacillus mesotrionivorans]|uniref:Uncharacterized protein n=1 Tax=Paenibacillus mesotrionivorans TaxID=3160968 RepID=A0ACC7NXI7_9BACL